MPNASKYFLGSIVAYSNELKKNILGVNEKVLMETGSVSVETVKEMISNLFKLTSADYAVAISGITGPSGGTTLKPVGTVCLAVAKRDEKIDAGILNFRGNRSMIVDYSVNFALGILYRQLVYNLNYF